MPRRPSVWRRGRDGWIHWCPARADDWWLPFGEVCDCGHAWETGPLLPYLGPVA
jgi:hypothetical protein